MFSIVSSHYQVDLDLNVIEQKTLILKNV